MRRALAGIRLTGLPDRPVGRSRACSTVLSIDSPPPFLAISILAWWFGIELGARQVVVSASDTAPFSKW